jgi:hypothetical protein
MLLHSQDGYTSLIPCAKITHIAAWSLLDDSSPLLLPQDTRTEQPWKVRIAQKAVKKKLMFKVSSYQNDALCYMHFSTPMDGCWGLATKHIYVASVYMSKKGKAKLVFHDYRLHTNKILQLNMLKQGCCELFDWYKKR